LRQVSQESFETQEEKWTGSRRKKRGKKVLAGERARCVRGAERREIDLLRKNVAGRSLVLETASRQERALERKQQKQEGTPSEGKAPDHGRSD